MEQISGAGARFRAGLPVKRASYQIRPLLNYSTVLECECVQMFKARDLLSHEHCNPGFAAVQQFQPIS
jgi:hypothetical protein